MLYLSRCLRCHPVRIVRYGLFLIVAVLLLTALWQYFIGPSKSFDLQDEFPSVDIREDVQVVRKHFVHSKSLLTSPAAVDPKAQSVVNYIASNLDIRYDVLSNDGGRFHVDITLTNKGNTLIDGCCWAIYFVHMKFIDTFMFNAGMPVPMRGEDINNLQSYDVQFELSHINGYTFRLKPNHKFKGLDVRQSMKLRITGGGWAVSRSEVLPNWYVTNDDAGTQPRLISSTAGEKLDFVGDFDSTAKTIRGDGDLYRPFSPEQRFRRNKVAIVSVENRLVPTPVSIQYQLPKQVISIKSLTWKIYHTKEVTNEANYLKEVLQIPIIDLIDPTQVQECSANTITIGLSETTHQFLSSERLDMNAAYRLTVRADPDCVNILAHQPVGAFYGVVSLISLAQGSSISKGLHVGHFEVDVVDIKDAPRFEYRGVMVDVARNFQPVRRLLKLIDVMALYKLNKLHIHLADDEGWRLEIPGLQELTEFGGRRGHDVNEQESLMSMLGSGPFTNTSGSGFYTVADYQNILRRAAAKHVEIIPEFDMPSHSHAAIKSMEYRYRRMKNTADDADNKKSQRYLLSDVEDQSIYLTGQFFRDSAINPCIESSYRFVEFIMTQVISLHSDIMPLKRWHFGGDEVPQDAYTGSPACQEFLRLNTHLSSTKDLKTYFVKRIIAMAGRHGLAMYGWEDAFTTAYGLPIERSHLKTTQDVVSQAYYNTWEGGGAAKAYQYANQGYKVILSPITALYFDNPQEPDPEDWGLHWATRYVDTKRSFHFIPDSLYDSIDEEFWGRPTSKNELCDTHRIQCTPLRHPENILGMEAALWSELIRTSGHLESQLWPRLFALAERSWHKASWEDPTVLASIAQSNTANKVQLDDWAQFATTVGHKELRRIERLGVKYYLPRPGARTRNGKLYVNTAFPGLVVQLSSDNGKTWQDYKRHTEYSGTLLLATRSFDGRRRSESVKVTVS